MTIAPDVLEELDFPTPDITPGARVVPQLAPAELDALFDGLSTLLAEIVELVVPGLTEAFARFARSFEGVQIPLLDASKITADVNNDPYHVPYCWCSPSRGMLFDSDLTIDAHLWTPDERPTA